jgi:hypothetical protein
MFAIFRRYLAAFGRSRGGTAAMEFAAIAPVMVLLALAGADTARYVSATEGISKAANTIGQMLTANSTGTVNYVDLQFYHDSTMVIFPDVLADAARRSIPWSQDISITMSSIQFTTTQTNCGSSCVYTAKVVWTGGGNPRPCGVALAAVPDGTAPSPTTLPTDAFGPGSVIAVDIAYTFRPWFSSFILSSIPISRSIYLAPRYIPLITYQVISGDNHIAASCP